MQGNARLAIEAGHRSRFLDTTMSRIVQRRRGARGQGAERPGAGLRAGETTIRGAVE